LRFLVDTQLPKLLSRRLKDAGHAAEHVLDLNLGQSPDNDLWRYASANDAVIVSKDEDFAQWVMSGRSGPKVVWLRVGNCTNAELVDWLLPVWPDVVNAMGAQNLILPSGTAKIGSTEYDIELNASPRVLDELNELPIKSVNGATIRVRDVAHVHDGSMPQQSATPSDFRAHEYSRLTESCTTPDPSPIGVTGVTDDEEVPSPS